MVNQWFPALAQIGVELASLDQALYQELLVCRVYGLKWRNIGFGWVLGFAVQYAEERTSQRIGRVCHFIEEQHRGVTLIRRSGSTESFFHSR